MTGLRMFEYISEDKCEDFGYTVYNVDLDMYLCAMNKTSVGYSASFVEGIRFKTFSLAIQLCTQLEEMTGEVFSVVFDGWDKWDED